VGYCLRLHFAGHIVRGADSVAIHPKSIPAKKQRLKIKKAFEYPLFKLKIRVRDHIRQG
jgi:hypothetical protein